MATVTIDLRGITPDQLRSAGSPALRDTVREAISPTRPIVDGGGFDNKAAAHSKAT